MMIVAVSISDPVRDVVDAMAKVEHGDIHTEVDVYERSEIGRLQNGFNRMVAGLAERDRLRDLFGPACRRGRRAPGVMSGPAWWPARCATWRCSTSTWSAPAS